MALSPSVLIVEDNEGHSDLIEEKLKTSFRKAKIKIARTLAEAYRFLPQQKWDIIILDTLLPDGKGMSFFDEISARQPYAAVAILAEDPEIHWDHPLNHHGAVEFLTKDRHTLQSFITRITRLMSTSRRIGEVLEGKTSSHYRSFAFRDPLTDLYSRDYFDEFLKQEISRANRYKHEFSIIITDIDGLRIVNHQQGYSMGDTHLKQAASLLTQNIRAGDIAARYHEDEFAILLPHCRKVDGIRCASRILNQIKKEMKESRLTLSIGMLHYQGVGKISRPEKILAQAKEALLKSKQLGGNRLTIAA